MRLPKHVIIGAKALFSAGVLFLLIQQTDTDRLIDLITPQSFAALLFISFVVALTSILLAYRWIILLRNIGEDYRLFDGIRNVLIGFFFNQFLPSTVGGDAVRIWLANKSGIRLSSAMSTILADRIHGFLGLLLVCLLGVPLLYFFVDGQKLVWGIVVLLLSGFGGLLCLTIIHKVNALREILQRFKYLEWTLPLADAVAGALIQKHIGYKVVLISVALHFIDLTLLFIVAQALLIEISWLHCLILVPPAILVSSLPISVAGWGLREGALVFALSVVGVQSADAIALSLFFGLSQMISGLVGGLMWLKVPKRTLDEARAIDEGQQP